MSVVVVVVVVVVAAAAAAVVVAVVVAVAALVPSWIQHTAALKAGALPRPKRLNGAKNEKALDKHKLNDLNIPSSFQDASTEGAIQWDGGMTPYQQAARDSEAA